MISVDVKQQWSKLRNQFWQSLEEGAGKHCLECGDVIVFPCTETGMESWTYIAPWMELSSLPRKDNWIELPSFARKENWMELFSLARKGNSPRTSRRSIFLFFFVPWSSRHDLLRGWAQRDTCSGQKNAWKGVRSARGEVKGVAKVNTRRVSVVICAKIDSRHQSGAGRRRSGQNHRFAGLPGPC